jgi:NAD(P)-dependent dehydrogenase (short-subunit alcohol dehydrogenase family)
MKQRVVLITGANRGIGRASALALAAQGARVVLVCRDEEKGRAVVREIEAAGGEGELLVADLASMTQVRAAAREFKETHERLDVLVTNAATMVPARRLTEDNLEETFAVNYLSHFILTYELLEMMQATGSPSACARIVNVSSEAHRDGYMRWHDLRFKENYSPQRAYAMSLLAKNLITRELARRLRGTHVTANALHPGRVATGFGIVPSGWRGIMHRLGNTLALTPEEGAKMSVWIASSPEVEGISGEYFVKGRRVKMSGFSLDEGLCRRMWTISEHLAGIRLMQFAA